MFPFGIVISSVLWLVQLFWGVPLLLDLLKLFFSDGDIEEARKMLERLTGEQGTLMDLYKKLLESGRVPLIVCSELLLHQRGLNENRDRQPAAHPAQPAPQPPFHSPAALPIFISPREVLDCLVTMAARPSIPATSTSSASARPIPLVTNVGGPFVCRICFKHLKTRENLRKHMLTHSHQQFPCGTCGKKYSREDNLKRHEKSHK